MRYESLLKTQTGVLRPLSLLSAVVLILSAAVESTDSGSVVDLGCVLIGGAGILFTNTSIHILLAALWTANTSNTQPRLDSRTHTSPICSAVPCNQ